MVLKVTTATAPNARTGTLHPEFFKPKNKMKILSKTKTAKHIEVTRVIRWECPICGDEHTAEDISLIDFKRDLINDIGVRYVEMDYMQGVCCPTCFNDPEIQKSTL